MKTTTLFLSVCASVGYAATRYVALDGGHVAPFTSWGDAATNIHAAVQAASSGDVVLVSNGIYRITSQVTLSKTLTVKSLAGPLASKIDCGGVTRAFYISVSNALVEGFTVTNGYTTEFGGGAIYCYRGTVRNCILLGSYAINAGGVLIGENGLVSDCVMMGNAARDGGGGAMFYDNGGQLRNSLIVRNRSSREGGGVYVHVKGTIDNCTIVDNWLTNAPGWYGGGIACVGGGLVRNCIIVSNQNENCENRYGSGPDNGGTYVDTCTSPLATGTGNIVANPLFVNGAQHNFRLQAGSPCINAGTNMPWMIGATDLDGQPRIISGRVDMGTYEFNPVIITITTAPTTVAYHTSAIAIAGTNENCIGSLWVSNAANTQVYSFSATPAWTSPEVTLEVGPNLITAYGTDTYGMVASSSVTITRKAATPAGVAASDGTFTNKIALAWLAAPGAVSYRVLRGETNDSVAADTIANAISNTVYDDTTAVPGVLYYYWLVAQQNGVEGDPSAPDSGYRQLQPSAGIAATLGYHTNKVDVSWAAVAGATKYRVYRADSPLTNLAALLASDITDTNYTDTTVTPGLVYYYWVQAQSAVAASTWSGATPGYALLAANFADKKMWSMRDTKKYDTLTCKQLPGPWSELLAAGWSIGIANALTHEIVSGPFELVTKNGRVWTLKSPATTITYTQRYNKRKDTYKVKLVYKFFGNMPTKPGFYLQPPAGN